MQSKRAPQLLLLLAFGCSLIFAFPHDPQPISLVNNDYYTRCPVFVGRRAGKNGSGSGSRPHIIDFQLMLRLGRWLLIAEREHIFGLQLDAIMGRELFYHKKLTWRASRQERKTCSMKGKSESECRNFIKVLLPRSDSNLFICGTNAYNPTCRLYLEDSLEQTGKNVSGMAKCPYDSRQSNVALFADDKLYTATVTDFLALDAVVYRSLSEPALRSLKHDSRWLKEPHFIRALEYGEHVYFFFREIAVEFTALGKVVVSRVARVCKNDAGGSQRVLERHWTSFVKARLNCSVPGESHFYFNELQAVTNVMSISGRDIVLGTFTTPANSIPGSAVCAFDMATVQAAFLGRFKEQRPGDAGWAMVPEERLPDPRPGSCARSGPAMSYSSSQLFPDDNLLFLKSHPLLDGSVPSLGEQPCFTRTIVRSRLSHIAVDPAAGPYGNHTVMFLASDTGLVLKVLLWPPVSAGMADPMAVASSPFLPSLLLEQIDVYDAHRCGEPHEHQVLGLELDTEGHTLYVAFRTCVLHLPLSRCHLYTCRRACLSARDPYCGWRGGVCIRLPHRAQGYEQELESKELSQMVRCPDVVSKPAPPVLPALGVTRELQLSDGDSLVPAALLAICVVAAFVLGAVLAILLTYWYIARRRQLPHATKSAAEPPSHLYSPPGLALPNQAKTRFLNGPVNSNTPSVMLLSTLVPSSKPRSLAHGFVIRPSEISSDGIPLPLPPPPPDLSGLPTPESTPVLQPKSSVTVSPICNNRARNTTLCNNTTNMTTTSAPGRSQRSTRVPRALILPTERPRNFPNFEHPGCSSKSSPGPVCCYLQRGCGPGEGDLSPQSPSQAEHQSLVSDLSDHHIVDGKILTPESPPSSGCSSAEHPPQVPCRDVSLKRTPSRHTPSRRVDVPTQGVMMERTPGYRPSSLSRRNGRRQPPTTVPSSYGASQQPRGSSKHTSFRQQTTTAFPSPVLMRTDSGESRPLSPRGAPSGEVVRRDVVRDKPAIHVESLRVNPVTPVGRHGAVESTRSLNQGCRIADRRVIPPVTVAIPDIAGKGRVGIGTTGLPDGPTETCEL
uniref:semaphorin-6B-like isoform X2 n=1 Tax=Myxine glutinosa TaxID=7769 RepID=UPI00358E7761